MISPPVKFSIDKWFLCKCLFFTLWWICLFCSFSIQFLPGFCLNFPCISLSSNIFLSTVFELNCLNIKYWILNIEYRSCLLYSLYSMIKNNFLSLVFLIWSHILSRVLIILFISPVLQQVLITCPYLLSYNRFSSDLTVFTSVFNGFPSPAHIFMHTTIYLLPSYNHGLY